MIHLHVIFDNFVYSDSKLLKLFSGEGKASVLEDQAESGLSSGGLRARGIADEWRDRGTTCWRTDRGIGGGRTDRGSSGGLRARGIADEWRDRDQTGGCETLTGNVAQFATAVAQDLGQFLWRLAALVLQVAHLFASVAPFEAALCGS